MERKRYFPIALSLAATKDSIYLVPLKGHVCRWETGVETRQNAKVKNL
jgi:hypothetical protein